MLSQLNPGLNHLANLPTQLALGIMSSVSSVSPELPPQPLFPGFFKSLQTDSSPASSSVWSQLLRDRSCLITGWLKLFPLQPSPPLSLLSHSVFPVVLTFLFSFLLSSQHALCAVNPSASHNRLPRKCFLLSSFRVFPHIGFLFLVSP